MRAVIIVAILILFLVAVGWLRFFSPDGNPSVQVDTDKVKEDTSAFVEESKRVIGQTADSIDQRTNDDSKVPLAPRTPGGTGEIDTGEIDTADADEVVVPTRP